MTKQQYSEFHKYLAMLIYDFTEIISKPNLTKESRIFYENKLKALKSVLEIVIIDEKL